MAIEIIQNVIPTPSLGSRFAEAANESVGSMAKKLAGIKYFKKDIYKLPLYLSCLFLATARSFALNNNAQEDNKKEIMVRQQIKVI